MFKSVPCGKCLFPELKQHIVNTFYSFVGTAVTYSLKTEN